MMRVDSDMEHAEEERWAPVPLPEYQAVYSVSTLGRVRSDKTRGRYPAGRILTPWTGTDGYMYVTLCSQGVKRRYTVHYLVMLTFIGERPSGMEICHRNDVRGDNRLSNLRYGSHSDNLLDCHRNGQKIGTQKLTLSEVAEIRELLKRGEDQRKVAKAYGVSQTAVSFIKLGRNWKHRLDQTIAA